MLKNAIWLFTLALLTLIFFLPSYTQMQDLKHKNREYEQQILDLTKKNMKLKEEKRLLKDDPEYFEKVARERMGLVRENEVIYKFVPVEQMNEKPQPPTAPKPVAAVAAPKAPAAKPVVQPKQSTEKR
jgi:cell division protein DivIC